MYGARTGHVEVVMSSFHKASASSGSFPNRTTPGVIQMWMLRLYLDRLYPLVLKVLCRFVENEEISQLLSESSGHTCKTTELDSRSPRPDLA